MSDATETSIYGMFPHSALLATHATGMEPTYESLHQSMTQLNANAASIPSSDGDGLLGHLVLTLGQTAYSAISAGNVAYPPPAPPPPVPDIPAAGAAAPTAALLAEIRLQHTDAKKTFQKYYAVDAALKKLLLAATDERFVISLKDRTHGFALVRTRRLIDHLYTTYGNITSEDLSANEERMKKTWDPTTPIEVLFAQIDDGTAFAISGDDPFSDAQLVRFAYNNVDSNQRMPLATRDWRLRPRAEHTWNNFKTAFKSAHLDLRLCTTGTAGFQGGAHHTEEVPPLAETDPASDDTTHAFLANLANAAIETNEQMTALGVTVAALKLQVETANTALAASQAAQRRGNNTRRTNTGSNPPSRRVPNYCWTHGGRVGRTHTSLACTNQDPGHQTAATHANRMGGSNQGCPTTR